MITSSTKAKPGTGFNAAPFPLSDEQPVSFGATTGQGEWGIFQQFLKYPKDVSGIQKKLEAAATRAYARQPKK